MLLGSWLASSSSTFYFCMLLCSIPLSAATVLERNALPLLSFEDGYTQLFGDDNLMLLKDGKSVLISLDQRTGSGFASQDLYLHGFFSAAIKLPSDYAAGVVVAFYMSNGDVFEKTHDELDFEFLGNIRGKEWRLQTNMYGNGSTSVGREERYQLWFDPTEDFHHYSFLWTQNLIIFFIDDIPIRKITRNETSAGHFPSKPMSLYATIWDGSSWATSGGRYKVNYKYAPYVAELTDLILHGCSMDPIEHSSTCHSSDTRLYNNTTLSTDERSSMEDFRNKHIVYSYCYDQDRYLHHHTPPPECQVDSHAMKRACGSCSVKLKHHHRGPRYRNRNRNRSHHRAKSFVI